MFDQMMEWWAHPDGVLMVFLSIEGRRRNDDVVNVQHHKRGETGEPWLQRQAKAVAA